MIRLAILRGLLATGVAVAGMVIVCGVGRADQFTYVDEQGNTVELEASLAGSGSGYHALETADGEIRLIPEAALVKREIADGPEPLSPEQLAEKLAERFGKDKFISHIDPPYVIGMVLMAPLPPKSEKKALVFLKKASRFMHNMERVFLDYARDVHLDLSEPKYPLVMLIFESNEQFDPYTLEATQGQGLSAPNIAGFYYELSNHLSIRMSECATFEVPLHEAIHQQVYNRGVFRRLAPTPAWFDEGIATGFEGDGEKINVGPAKVKPSYARMAVSGTRIPWSQIVERDDVFGGDILAGEAYADAWSLHWLLLTRYPSEYANYVKLLAQKEPLTEYDSAARMKDLETAFGKKIDELEGEFRMSLDAAVKRQRVSFATDTRAGLYDHQSNLGDVQVKAVRRDDLGGALEVTGRLKNISPLRPLAFHVTVETDSGTYAEWFVPNLGANQTTPLAKQVSNKLMQNSPGGPANQFLVRVYATLPDGETVEQWKRTGLPVPEFQR